MGARRQREERRQEWPSTCPSPHPKRNPDPGPTVAPARNDHTYVTHIVEALASPGGGAGLAPLVLFLKDSSLRPSPLAPRASAKPSPHPTLALTPWPWLSPRLQILSHRCPPGLDLQRVGPKLPRLLDLLLRPRVRCARTRLRVWPAPSRHLRLGVAQREQPDALHQLSDGPPPAGGAVRGWPRQAGALLPSRPAEDRARRLRGLAPTGGARD